MNKLENIENLPKFIELVYDWCAQNQRLDSLDYKILFKDYIPYLDDFLFTDQAYRIWFYDEKEFSKLPTDLNKIKVPKQELYSFYAESDEQDEGLLIKNLNIHNKPIVFTCEIKDVFLDLQEIIYHIHELPSHYRDNDEIDEMISALWFDYYEEQEVFLLKPMSSYKPIRAYSSLDKHTSLIIEPTAGDEHYELAEIDLKKLKEMNKTSSSQITP